MFNFDMTSPLERKRAAMAVCVIAVLAILFVPLPSFLLDMGLVLSITASVLVLMVALWLEKPLDFDSFPILLLIVTMVRLSLNIASTRLILSEGHTGTNAAGNIIEGFSQFVVGGNFVIGVIVFAVLIIINFMVITKGSTRIAEVQARFTLDSIPGKQMAIDADLGAGIIDEMEAKKRREELQAESSFFGSMDGAAKFVKGDAVAGLIITGINCIGGIIIGVMQRDMALGDAATSYINLTIGDGLVSQIPALIVSLAVGLIVTKGNTTGAASDAILKQVGKRPNALYMSAMLLFCIGLMPGFPFLFFTASAASLGFIAYTIQKKYGEEEALRVAKEAAEKDTNSAYAEDTPEDLLKVDDIKLELGGALLQLIQSMDSALPTKVRSLRNVFAEEFGFILPKVNVRDASDIDSEEYRICIQGTVVARGFIKPNHRMVISPTRSQINLPGVKAVEPSFGLPVVWVEPEFSDQAEAQGFVVVEPDDVVVTHLQEVLRDSMSDLMTYGATKTLVDRLDRDYQKLVADMPAQNNSQITLVQNVLRQLLNEKVSIKNLPLIVESISEALSKSSNVDMISEHVRTKLCRQICESLEDPETGNVPVIILNAEWEEILLRAVQRNGDSLSFMMEPDKVSEFKLAGKKALEPFAMREEWPSVLVNEDLRRYVRDMLARVSPRTRVISNQEIHRSAKPAIVAKIV